MSIDRVTRKRSSTEDEEPEKKRKLFGSDDKKSDDAQPKEKKSLFKKDKKEEPTEAPTYEPPSGDGYGPGQTTATYTPRPAPRPRTRPQGEGRRVPYDELSMPIKVRNRTQSDVSPGQMGAPVRNRAEPGALHVQTPGYQAYEGPTKVHHEAFAGAAGASASAGGSEEDEWRGGTWEDSGYRATDEEAHRDKVYNPPSFLVQMLIVMFAQMKLFSKGKATIVLIVMIALIPIIVLLIPDYIDLIATEFGATISNAYTGMLLVLLPIIMALFTAKQCGTQIPNEFKERTAYMSIPLPMHRLAFYFGKYLAGFLYCLALFLLAFGVAVACTAFKFDSFYIDVLAAAFAGTVVAIFVYSTTAFCIGCFLRRGSVLLPLVLNLVAFPFLFYLLAIRLENTAFLMAPVFLPDAIIQSMGFPVSASVMGLLGSFSGSSAGFGSMWTMCALGLVWGAAFLALGAYRMTRREM